jgi:glucosamine kinase
MSTSSGIHCGLGLDMGGTATRWALSHGPGEVFAQGQLPIALDGHITQPSNQGALREHVLALAAAVRGHGTVHAALAGATGLDGQTATQTFLVNTLAQALHLPTTHIRLGHDLLISYLAAWAPGEGHLVYAGTGSVAAHVDTHGRFHRAGGRGHLLDDAGGGYWIAKEALRRIWRDEDERPGRWRDSPMAVRLLGALGGTDWRHTVQAVYRQGRGSVGLLAQHVAASADTDPRASHILHRAGTELARLAEALVNRLGTRPVVLAGGAAHLHPLILQSMRAALKAPLRCELRDLQSHVRAAQLAAAADFFNNPLFTEEVFHTDTEHHP